MNAGEKKDIKARRVCTSDTHYLSIMDRAFQTICEMLLDRGFHETVEFFKGQIGNETHALEAQQVVKLEHPTRVRLVFYNHAKLQKAQEFITRHVVLADAPVDLVIVVFREKMNSTHIKLIEDQSTPTMSVQVFDLKELYFNISKHNLVPKHEIIPQEEAARLMEFLNAKKGQMPNILHTDKMAKYLNVRPGQMVKITRPSPTAGEYVFYRLCV